jgi:hypothetical protein
MMMQLDEILKLWEADSKIDEVNLDESSVKSAALHSKYLELYSLAKLALKKKELSMANLRKDKWLYYNAKMTKEEMDERGWAYDPFNGMSKPLKSDMDMFYTTDPDIIKLQGQIEYQATIVEALKDIMDNIKWRHTTIKNIIDWKRFTSGI